MVDEVAGGLVLDQADEHPAALDHRGLARDREGRVDVDLGAAELILPAALASGHDREGRGRDAELGGAPAERLEALRDLGQGPGANLDGLGEGGAGFGRLGHSSLSTTSMAA